MKIDFADVSASIADLKKNPIAVIEHAEGLPVAILDHNNRPVAYLIPAPSFERLLGKLEDVELAALVRSRQMERKIKITLDDL